MSPSCGSLLAAQTLDEQVVELYAVIEVVDAQAFILAVSTFVIDVFKRARDAIGGNAADAQILAVAGAGIHRRHHGNAAVEPGAELLELLHERRAKLRRRRRYGIID